MSKSIILTDQEIQHKIRRIAFQVYESNSKNKELIIAGISKNGFSLAQQLKKVLDEVSELKTTLCEVHVNKEDPLKEITTSLDVNDYKSKPLVLVDDVLNSGTTLMYAIKHFLEVPLKQFKTAVLVNRNHKKYPVKADFKGISLSTSLQEHVTVKFSKKEVIAYLS